MSKIITVTDLGPGSKGTISADDLTVEEKDKLINDTAKPEYHAKASKRFRCVDGRVPFGGLRADNGQADPQIAGGAAISETAADLMGLRKGKLSALIAKNTKENIEHGFMVVVHGDDKNGQVGCGANKHLRAVLRSNAENINTVMPIAWTLAEALGLDAWLDKADVTELIVTGQQNAENEGRWDIKPEVVIDLAVENGATYEELVEDHMERLIVVDVSEGAFDEERFMHDHIRHSDGKPIEAFVASLGAIRAKLFTMAQQKGQTDRLAARKTMGVILFNIGVSKELTMSATESRPETALPVVVLGDTAGRGLALRGKSPMLEA